MDAKKFVILSETNMEHGETWYSFIRWNSNENEIRYLYKQLIAIEMNITDNLSTFDIDIENFVDEYCVNQMINVNIGTYPHQKYDNKIDYIDFDISINDSYEKIIEKISEFVGYGNLEKSCVFNSDDSYSISNNSSDDYKSDENLIISLSRIIPSNR
jgi:hypothetical protein